jgi:hypothetical protein
MGYNTNMNGKGTRTNRKGPEMAILVAGNGKASTAKSLVDELRTKYAHLAEVDGRLAEQIKDGVVNPIELGRWIGVNPPRIYGDIRAGRVEGVTDNNTQKIVIRLEEAMRYAAKVLGKRVNLAEKKAEEEAKMAKKIEAEVLKKLAEKEAAK